MTVEPLRALEAAISDVGHWIWWTDEAMPEAFQVEFGWVQLWQRPKSPTLPPDNRVALRVQSPELIAFLEFSGSDSDSEDETLRESDWPELLKRDELEPLPIFDQLLTVSSTELAKEICGAARVRSILCGTTSDLEKLTTFPVFLAFRCGNTGFAAAGAGLQAFSFEGELPLESIVDLHKQWWQYWRKYWDLRDSSPMPRDNLCEINMPAAGP